MKFNIKAICLVILVWVFAAFIFWGAWAFAVGIKSIWIPCFVILFLVLSIFGYCEFSKEEE